MPLAIRTVAVATVVLPVLTWRYSRLYRLRHLYDFFFHDGLNVPIRHPLFPVGTAMKRWYAFSISSRSAVPHLLDPLAKGVPYPNVCPDQTALGNPDGARGHISYVAPFLQDPVLVDARLVGKGVLSDDGFVRLYRHARSAR